MSAPIQLADSNYPLLDVFWTMLWLFLWIMWIFLLIRIITDVFRSRDLSGGAKAAWTIFLILFPFIAALVYLIARGSKMHERDVAQSQAADQAARSYIQAATGTSSSTAEELTKLAGLRDQGVLTPEEFESQKARLLG